jgi:HK97 family phage portal protein
MAFPFAQLAKRIFAKRTTGEPRYPATDRIAYSGRSVAGTIVTPDTAVTVATVWACLRYLSQTVAVLPWHVMRQDKDGGRTAQTHPIDWLLYKRPNPEWSSFQFRETLTHWALRWGNGYAEIERDPLARPVALWPIHPERVRPLRDIATGVLYYDVFNGAEAVYGQIPMKVRLESADMFHIRGFGEGPVGVNVMHYAAESIGWAKAAQLFGAAFFGNGMNISGVVQVKRALDETGMKRLTTALQGLYRGVRNANKYAVLDAETEFKPVGVEPDKAQFVATQQLLIDEVCRWFGVPPHKVGHLLRSTFSNIEQQAIEVVVDSISPWVSRFEDEADYKLFGQNRPGYYTKMFMNALMRGDFTSRSAFYTAMRNMGAYSVNDILRMEDANTIGPEGDKRIVQSNFTTLEKIGETAPAPSFGAETPAAPAPGRKTAPGKTPPPAEDGEVAEGEGEDQAQARLDRFFAEAADV